MLLNLLIKIFLSYSLRMIFPPGLKKCKLKVGICRTSPFAAKEFDFDRKRNHYNFIIMYQCFSIKVMVDNTEDST